MKNKEKLNSHYKKKNSMMHTLRQECVTCPCRIKVKRQPKQTPPKKDIFGITLIALKLKNKNISPKEKKPGFNQGALPTCW